MLGRAAIGQPWLPGAIATALDKGGDVGQDDAPAQTLSRAQKADAMREHYDFLLSSMGRDAGVRHARKHLAACVDALWKGVPLLPESQHKDRQRLVTSDNSAEVLSLLERLIIEAPLGNDTEAPPDDRASINRSCLNRSCP
jgi:tRNA-dihydrouridine synthase